MKMTQKNEEPESEKMKSFYESKCDKCNSSKIIINIDNPGLQTCLNCGNVMTIKHKNKCFSSRVSKSHVD